MSDQTPIDADGLPVPDPDFETKRRAQFEAFFAAAVDGEDVEEPRLHAVDPGWFRDLTARIPGLLLHEAGGVCPFQSTGTLHGLPFYFRYRSGYASLKVMSVEDPDGLFAPLYMAGVEYGDHLAGCLDRDEFDALMIRLVPMLERAPMLWEFAGQRPDVEPAQGRRAPAYDRAAWGHTPQEAWDRLHETSPHLVELGMSAEQQAERIAALRLDPTPINRDERVYPDPEPEFVVLD